MNRQNFAYVYSALGVTALLIGRILIPVIGVEGMGIGVLMADVAMLGWLIYLMRRIHVIHPDAMQAEVQAFGSLLRRRLGRAA
jgi:O-antigen/teichoic acid export membrane protein